ncbi:MAG: hypothetical protein M1828_005512 [Chrysothrix sp. TS-e1954]|nr:MAG: hypothetical protein M1828_005512 [Chrysothrix sp. TS-e1954]
MLHRANPLTLAFTLTHFRLEGQSTKTEDRESKGTGFGKDEMAAGRNSSTKHYSSKAKHPAGEKNDKNVRSMDSEQLNGIVTGVETTSGHDRVSVYYELLHRISNDWSVKRQKQFKDYWRRRDDDLCHRLYDCVTLRLRDLGEDNTKDSPTDPYQRMSPTSGKPQVDLNSTSRQIRKVDDSYHTTNEERNREAPSTTFLEEERKTSRGHRILRYRVQ